MNRNLRDKFEKETNKKAFIDLIDNYVTYSEDYVDWLEKQLILHDVVFSEAELKTKLEEQLEETRQWLISEDFEGLAERL